MLDDYGYETFEDNPYPLAYLITFRTYGTWLHGDERGAYQRGRNKSVGPTPIAPNTPLAEEMSRSMKQETMILNVGQRKLVESAIADVCAFRGYTIKALNARSNHVHVVVSKAVQPQKIVNDLKAYSTRRLRELGEVPEDRKVWSRGASTRYLWKPLHVESAIEYVLYSQGDVPFDAVM